MRIRLGDAPVGLFEFDGTIGFKSEYGKIKTDEKGTFVQVEAFVVCSGEYFWGGAETSRERNDLLVTPLYIKGRKLKKLRSTK